MDAVTLTAFEACVVVLVGNTFLSAHLAVSAVLLASVVSSTQVVYNISYVILNRRDAPVTV